MKVSRVDISKLLRTEDDISGFLAAAMEDYDPDVFLACLADVAKARGITHLAESTGLNRESLYKSLAPGARPRFDTIIKITKALGVTWIPVAATSVHDHAQ
jgi:probable addiction module antidote protein